MVLEKLPDDLIQCLVLGAFNTRLAIESNVGSVTASGSQAPLTAWTELQPFFLD